MSRPVISVVVPSFNQAKFLERTLDSIVLQSYPVELIVIDGGSSDGSVDILNRYKDRISYWVSEPDHGQTHAINKGMARATGDVLAYLNSDDMYLPGALQVVADAARANPEADLLHGRCITIDENDTRLETEFFSDIETPEDILDLWQVWYQGRNLVQPEVFWTRRCADRVGPFDEGRHYAMDYDYWCRAILSGGKVHHIDREVSAFRLWAAQKSSAADKAASELREIAIRHLKDPVTPIPSARRRQLIGDWAFDEIYSKRGSVATSKPALQRRLAMLHTILEEPRLIYSRSFWRHARKIVHSWLR